MTSPSFNMEDLMKKFFITLSLISLVTFTTHPVNVHLNFHGRLHHQLHEQMPLGATLRQRINDFNINDILNLRNNKVRLSLLCLVGACMRMQNKEYSDTHLDAKSLLNPFNILFHPISYIDDALIGHAGAGD